MFYLAKCENGRMGVAEPQYHPVTANLAITEGMALVITSGKLAKCGATTVPTYIAMSDLAATATDRVIPVIPVHSNQIYKVACSAVPAVGAKVTIDSTALLVTATTTDGVATVVDTNGATAAGDEVYVHF